MVCKICNGTGVIDNGKIKGTDEEGSYTKHTYSECDCKEKEKSVLTEKKIKEIEGLAHKRVMVDETNESIPELYSRFSIEEAFRIGFQAGQTDEYDRSHEKELALEAKLANYKKGLREKVENEMKLAEAIFREEGKGSRNHYNGKIEAFWWLLKELG